MINPVSSAVPAQAAVQPKAVSQQPAQSKPQPASDTVQISNAAKQALQEAIETSVQTAKEAAGGDMQARRLLAREAAEHVSAK
jgi:hypothetical protein